MRPVLESENISSVARKSNPQDVLLEVPVYNHYFGLALYDLLQTFTQQIGMGAEGLSATFRGVSHHLPRDRLDTASDMIRTAAAFPSMQYVTCSHGMLSTKDLQRSEMSYTTVYSVAHDRLVFGDSQFGKKGMVAHQGPVRKKARMQGNPECSDLLGIRMIMGVPSESVFVSDIKIGDPFGSTVETALYGKFASLSQQQSKEAVLVIGLSATVHTASLWLYVIAHKEVWGIPILKDVKPWDKCHLSTLCIGLRSLSARPIRYNILVSPQPWVEPTTYSALKKRSSNRTFRNISTKEVFKIFDREESTFLPNLHVMECAGLNVSESRLSADGRYLIVKYPYIEGNHKPQSLQQFRGVLDILQKIHGLGYVHGDIRPPNIIFNPDGLNSYLIDFDLARKDGYYPLGYYFSDTVRHEDARAGLDVEKVHDLHSLRLIIQHFFGDIAKDT